MNLEEVKDKLIIAQKNIIYFYEHKSTFNNFVINKRQLQIYKNEVIGLEAIIENIKINNWEEHENKRKKEIL